MKTFKEFICEMAAPSKENSDKIYYHGTTSREAAKSIAKNGIVAPVVPAKKNSLTPVAGKVYITPHIDYASIYAMGGDIASTEHLMPHHKTDPHGYVFAVHGHTLKHVQPDEDSVGEMIYKKSNSKLNHLASYHLGEPTLRKIHDGEYTAWARGGKSIMKHLTDDHKNELIHQGAHVAHEGTLHPHAIYRIHHSKIKHLKRDGSNFFEHAEKIEPHEI